MADADACDLIEEWARGALEEADLELPEGVAVRASAGGDGGTSSDDDERRADGYALTVEVPEGEGAQQLANMIQSAMTDAVTADPTLGGRFEEVQASPAGADLVAFGETGAQSKFELTVLTAEPSDDEQSGDGDGDQEEAADGDDEEAGDGDDDESGDGDDDRPGDDQDDDAAKPDS